MGRGSAGMARLARVLLDCDSTLSRIEGIDELGGAHREAIVPLTEAAMRGDVPLDAVYGRRLAIIRPDRDAVARVAQRYEATAVPGAHEAVAALQRAGVEVRIVSGGLRQAILPFAAALGVPAACVHAVDVRFDAEGRYAGFDEGSPLARQGGKATVIRGLPPVAGRTMLVGDGVTDLEAKPIVDVFVAFAGVVRREAVVAGADVAIHVESLLPVVALALDEEQAAAAGVAAARDAGAMLLAAPPPIR